MFVCVLCHLSPRVSIRVTTITIKIRAWELGAGAVLTHAVGWILPTSQFATSCSKSCFSQNQNACTAGLTGITWVNLGLISHLKLHWKQKSHFLSSNFLCMRTKGRKPPKREISKNDPSSFWKHSPPWTSMPSALSDRKIGTGFNNWLWIIRISESENRDVSLHVVHLG